MTKTNLTTHLQRIERWENINQFIVNPRMGGNWLRPAASKIESILMRLHSQGQLGGLVLDAGASWSSIAVERAPNRSTYLVIAVDIGFFNAARLATKESRFDPDLLRVKGDLHELKQALEQREVKDFLTKRGIGDPFFKIVLMCDILNYIDYKQVLSEIKENFLLPGGRIVTCNMAGVVLEPGLAHPKGVKSNLELLSFARRLGLVPEEIIPPASDLDSTANKDHVSRQVLVLKRPENTEPSLEFSTLKS